jgi:glycosyltransferase involved in cell wall biosynthesis
MNPMVTIVIPVFSRASTIVRAIESVTAQAFSDYEIIVVDDGSTDETAERVGALSAERLRLIRHDENEGAAAARNTGIKAARGEWIAFLDSDDVWTSPEKLSRQLAALRASAGNARGCATGYVLHKKDHRREVRLDLTAAEFRREILYGCHIAPGTTLMVAREVFDDIGLFDEDLHRFEDWDWLLRFLQKYDLTFVPEPLAAVFAGDPFSQPESASTSTLAALDRIGARHLARALPRIDRRRLSSSLLIERAAIYHRMGRPVRAVSLVMGSLLVYPFRKPAFFGRLVSSLALHLARAPGWPR